VNEAWFNIDADKAGIYRGQCAELCGRDHAFMPIVVDARKKEDFDAWLAEKAAQQKQAAAPAGAESTPTANAPAAAAPATLASADASANAR
jgi:cytochrome c oxidase subunit 2